MKKILLFTGAGMSVPMGLPAATGFANTIKKCDPDLLDLLTGHLGDDAKDIEKILYVIDEFVTGSNFYRHLVANLSGNNSYYRDFERLIARYNGYADSFQQTVKSDIFRILQNYNSLKALTIYKNILAGFKERDDFSLSIFTTNYDLIFEEVVSENAEIFEELGYTDFYYGFTNKYGKIRFDKHQDFKWSTEIIEYNKLHGSLDWSKDSKGVVVKTGVNTVPAEPEKMPLLYPGYKGTPNEEPFITMHNKLYLRLIQCDEVHIVGFAFRDPYINSIFEFALRARPELMLNCYNPAPLDQLPNESAIPIFLKTYPDQFSYKKNAISDSDNPLDIPPF